LTDRQSPSIAIRRATAADVETVAHISASAYAEAYLPVVGRAPKPATEDYVPWIAGNDVWLLEAAGETRGVIVLERRADHLFIYSIAVEPKFQRNGHARELLRFADREARSTDVNRIRLHTNPRIERNLMLYRRNGYVETGRRPHPSFATETLVDMEKTLAPGDARHDLERSS
jgi:ribosomal protein S18 acetylase RimI-like enzyme